MNQDIEQFIVGLRRAGLRPTQKQWEVALGLDRHVLPALIDLAADTAVLVGPEPAAYGPLHALRLLSEWNPLDGEVVERLLQTLPLSDPEPGAQAAFVWRQDLPQILGGAGLNALVVARRLLFNTDSAPDRRAATAETMGYTVAIDDALRDDVVTTLSGALATEPDPYVLAYIIDTLANLGATDAYKDVMSSYQRGAVDKGVVRAADVRPRLLSGKLSDRMECVRHTLAERYEQHGPYTEEQRRAMAEQYRRSQGQPR